MAEHSFNPFYERWASSLGIGVAGKILIAFVCGLAFFLPYYALAGNTALRDWSWLLAVLIACALLFLYFATATLRGLLEDLETHGLGNRALFQTPLLSALSDRNFLAAALFFGTANTLMGLLFGLPVGDDSAIAILLCGYFIAGFVCGLPAMGIFGVVAAFRKFTAGNSLKLDYTAPDRCGGISFVGAALVKFSVVTLLEGGLIAAYILLTDWSRAEDSWVQLLMWGWIVFPFLLSLLVLILPATDLNQMLTRYRQKRELELKEKCARLREQIEAAAGEGIRDALCSEYDFLCRRREEVHHMRTWPFTTGATTSFVGAFCSNLVVAVELGRTLL